MLREDIQAMHCPANQPHGQRKKTTKDMADFDAGDSRLTRPRARPLVNAERITPRLCKPSGRTLTEKLDRVLRIQFQIPNSLYCDLAKDVTVPGGISKWCTGGNRGGL
jgi:hypothetical protein